MTFYLIAMTAMITRRVLVGTGAEEGTNAQRERKLPAAAVGGAGGFLDAVGGGGWGPIVTSTLLSRGDHPRHAIGTVSLSEFFLTVAISVTFLLNLDLSQYVQPVLGLVIGGAAAAPLAGYLSRILPPRVADHRRRRGGRHSERGEYRPPRLAVFEGPVGIREPAADCRVMASHGGLS